MSCTPGTPDDWTDTVEPKRAEAFIEYLSINIGYNLRHYASPHASHQMGEGCQCRPSRIPHITLAAPESARPATLTPEQPVKAPGRDGDIFLTRRTPVEVRRPNGSRLLRYVDENGYQVDLRHVGSATPFPWDDGRIVRVLTEDKPAQETGLPRQIKPEDVRVGMVVECRDLVRVTAVHSGIIEADRWSEYRHPRGQEFRADAESETCERQWWLVEDAPEPEPVDPDAAAIEALVTAYRRSPECSTDAVFGEAMLDHLRAQGFDVTPRAEQ